jgi:16S rRNA (adenine1518-N6/adenine1519-N6)-dimethyltransferase
VTDVRPQRRSEIKQLLERHGLRPRKHLGQHFLADANVVEKIVRLAAVSDGDRVVEVGVGTGTLTRGLAASGATVVGYEVDRGLEPLLAEALEDVPGVDIRFEDALEVDLGKALGRGPWTMVANLPYNVGTPLLLESLRKEVDLGKALGRGPWTMVANLPYNVGTPLLLESLRNVPTLTRFVVMLQKEVADRLVAEPGSPSYGLPSVSLALRAEAKRAFVVPPQVFVPRPDVDSAVIIVERVAAHPLADRADVLAAAAFNQRRKMLRRSLIPVVVNPVPVLEQAGIDPEARAEALSAEDYLRLAEAVP